MSEAVTLVPRSVPYRVRTGTVRGHSHNRLGVNNQDAFRCERFSVGNVEYLLGVVCDGCSTKEGRKSHNEVGATLLAAYAVYEVRLLLAAGTPLREIPRDLYQRCGNYLGTIARMTAQGRPAEVWEFVRLHLMATMVGFIMDDTTTITFSAGDGVVIVNDCVQIIDQKNLPTYVGYHAVDPSILGVKIADQLPRSFVVQEYETPFVERLAVCSDGITKPKDGADAVSDEWREAIWGNEPQAPAGLQWWLKLRSNEGEFSDDCTIIAINSNAEKGPTP